MAKNKLIWKYTDNGYVAVEGTRRQPTVVEALNFLAESHGPEETFVIAAQQRGEYYAEDECTALVLIPVRSGDPCPICGHEPDVYQNFCPLCLRKWESEGSDDKEENNSGKIC